ncbi:OprD family outer membrane porin [Aestuariirhabdus sp. LZHN29]|uniref:OprD family outer membrane porin n=1 Tax=Aestuariirhabdus sp. LZHN29 TaxID=3417462 RepID=UPI003CEA452E
MNAFKISALAAAVVAASSVTTVAQADAAAAWDQFANDSKLSLHLRNFYHDRSRDNNGNVPGADQDQKSWAQAFRFDFSSGMAGNMVGVDAFGYYNQKLAGDRGEGGLGTLRGADKQESHGKSGAALKVNVADVALVKVGKFRMSGPMVNDSDSRNLPSVRQGAQIRSTFSESLNLYSQMVTGGSAKTNSGTAEYEVDGDRENVYVVGGDYTFGGIGNGLLLSAAYGKQTNNAEGYYAAADIDFDITDGVNLALGTQYGATGLIGNAETAAKPLKDDDISWFDVGAAVAFGPAKISVAYQSVEQQDDVDGYAFDTSSFAWEGGDDDTGFYGRNSVQIGDFNNNGEDSYQVRGDLNFADLGVPGLTLMARYIDGTVDKKSVGGTKDDDETELDMEAAYTLQDGMAKGLKFRIRYAQYEYDTNEAGEKKFELDDFRFITTYTLSVF